MCNFVGIIQYINEYTLSIEWCHKKTTKTLT